MIDPAAAIPIAVLTQVLALVGVMVTVWLVYAESRHRFWLRLALAASAMALHRIVLVSITSLHLFFDPTTGHGPLLYLLLQNLPGAGVAMLFCWVFGTLLRDMRQIRRDTIGRPVSAEYADARRELSDAMDKVDRLFWSIMRPDGGR